MRVMEEEEMGVAEECKECHWVIMNYEGDEQCAWDECQGPFKCPHGVSLTLFPEKPCNHCEYFEKCQEAVRRWIDAALCI